MFGKDKRMIFIYEDGIKTPDKEHILEFVSGSILKLIDALKL